MQARSWRSVVARRCALRSFTTGLGGSARQQGLDGPKAGAPPAGAGSPIDETDVEQPGPRDEQLGSCWQAPEGKLGDGRMAP